MFAFQTGSLPLVSLLLLVLFILVFLIFEVRARAALRRALTGEIDSCVQSRLGALVGDILRQSEEARRQLAAFATLHREAQERKNGFDSHLGSAKEEIEKLLSEIRATAAEAAKFAPATAALEWTPPETLLRLAVQAPDWPAAAGHLSRIDRENATSRDFQSAGDICADRAIYAKALEFYKLAADKDPENFAARAELLALTAEFRATERAESLQVLHDLVAQNLTHPLYGSDIEKRYFRAMISLGRHREWSEFCEAQLKQPLPRAVQSALLRHLALCWQKLGRQEEAIATCDAALKLSPEDSEVLALYSRLLLHAKKYEESYRMAVRLLQRNPASTRNYMLLAEIQERRIGRPAARDLLKRALQWASAKEQFEIEDYQAKLAALDELSQTMPATQPQIIQA